MQHIKAIITAEEVSSSLDFDRKSSFFVWLIAKSKCEHFVKKFTISAGHCDTYMMFGTFSLLLK